MDPDQPSPESPDLATSDHIDQISPSQTRSYECTFCKRGFTNAQALGGHMNIHRKDKAKLKELQASINSSNDQIQQSLEIPKTMPPPSYSQIPMSYFLPLTEAKKPSDQELIRSTVKLPWNNNINIPVTHESHVNTIRDGIKKAIEDNQVIQQLPLFTEMPSLQKFVDNRISGTDQKIVLSTAPPSHGLTGSDQLDLELRLGPEPDQNLSAGCTGTTRQFF